MKNIKYLVVLISMAIGLTNCSEIVDVNGVPLNLVYVEGGSFIMGSDANDANEDEKPMHKVTVNSFKMSKTEVTQTLWETVMGSNPSSVKGDSLPVECVSWDDCQKFIVKLNEMTGQKFRLPTEAEWEWAARGGTMSDGYKYAGGKCLDSVAWHHGNSDDKSHKVAGKLRNELGLYDMSGNVSEWCQDWYGEYSADSVVNPQGPSNGSYRVIRGGGWNSYAESNTVSSRYHRSPDVRYGFIGLRLVLPVEESQE